MTELSQLPEKQKNIAEIILAYYTPGTLENHDEIIEIDSFVDLFAPVRNYNLFEIEKVMEILGFKDDECRIDLSFFVKLVPKKKEE
jgi:hypothetical protein